jgi:hypothetical protein
LLLFGLSKKEQDAVYLQELVHKGAPGQYPLPGRIVCRSAYLLLRGIGKDRLSALGTTLQLQSERGGVSIAPIANRNAGSSRPSLKTVIALNFVVTLALSCGDANPVTGIVHVWMFRCLSTLWAMFGTWCHENKVTAGDKLGLTAFFALFKRGGRWYHLLEHIKFKRCVTQKICSTCGSLMVERRELFVQRLVRGSAEWLAWEARSAAHYALIWAERRCYSELRERVRAGAVNISAYIIDASKPLRHPRRLFDSQAARAIPQLSGAFIGVLSHTTQRALAFVSPAPGVRIWHAARAASAKKKARAAGTAYTWESTDVNCTLLLRVLLHDWANGVLHRHIHIQVDGGSDARGFVLLMLLALLVSLDFCDSVTIASLIPGHTHDDVDSFFSRLWKALKTRAGVVECRTWREILARACEVFPGWHMATTDKVGPAGVTLIAFVWKLRELFGQGSGCSTRPCLSPKLKGLWGAGTHHATKPSRFVIVASAESCRPVVSAYLSSVDGAPLFHNFRETEVFRFCPNLDLLEGHDLSIGWAEQHAALVVALDAGDCRAAGYSEKQREEIRAMVVDFQPAPKDPFGSRASEKFAALLELGFAPPKGVRVAPGRAPGSRPAAPDEQRPAFDEDGDDAAHDGADEWNSDKEGDEENEAESEAGELDEEQDEGSDEASTGEGVQYEIEDWLDRRFNEVLQATEYYLKFVGHDAPEWILERLIAHCVPAGVRDRFDQRSSAEKIADKSARKAQLWRESFAQTGDDEVVEDGDGAAAAGPPAPGGQEPASKRPRRSKRIAKKK